MIARRRGDAPVDSILGRRDVAIMPWAAITICALAIALSTLLRPGDGVDHLVLWGSVAGGIAAATGTALQDSTLGVRYRGALWIYVVVSGLVLSALVALALHDQGLATAYYTANVMLASYLGLVFPPVWSRWGLAVMLAATVLVQAINPDTHLFDAIIVGGLIIAGWICGKLGSLAHARAARVATALSSYDQLTAMLNRRGFLRQVEANLSVQQGGSRPELALLIIDLDGFKAVNDTHGHAAGDELLAWVGQTIPLSLPADAELGRLGGDEFAILLPGASASEAVRLAHDVRSRLVERIGCSIGVATSETRAALADDLFRVGDAAMYICKRDRSLGVHALVAGATGKPAPRVKSADGSRGKPLSYAQLRSAGKAPRLPDAGITYGWMVARGLIVIAMCGAYIVVGAYLGDGSSFWVDVLRYIGPGWVLFFVFLASLTWGRGLIEEGTRYWVVLGGSCAALGIGVGSAMLSAGGLTAPIGGALFLRVLFDAAILPPRHSRFTFATMFAAWVAVAILGPADQLWVIPFHLGLFAAAFALGTVGQGAFADLTRHIVSQAHTDALTKVRNRLGFENAADAALITARTNGSPFGLLVLDLDDFKSVNDTRGHAAGDALLCEVAEVLAVALPDSQVIGRLGGDEFVALIPVSADDDALVRSRGLAAALRSTVGASVGHAVFPQDGDDLDALLLAADQRSYEVKRTKPARAGRSQG